MICRTNFLCAGQMAMHMPVFPDNTHEQWLFANIAAYLYIVYSVQLSIILGLSYLISYHYRTASYQGWKWVGWPGLFWVTRVTFLWVKWVSSAYLDVTQNRLHVLQKNTLASHKRVNLRSGECTEPSLVWNKLLPQAVLNHVVSRDFILKNYVCGTSSVSWRNLWHCFISDFFHVIIRYAST